MSDTKLAPILEALRRGDIDSARNLIRSSGIKVAVDPTQMFCIDAVLEGPSADGLSLLIEEGVRLGVIKMCLGRLGAAASDRRWAGVRWLEEKGLIPTEKSPHPDLRAWAAELLHGKVCDAVALGQWSDAHTKKSNFFSGLAMLIALPFAGSIKERKGGLVAVSGNELYCVEIGFVMMPGWEFGLRDAKQPLESKHRCSWSLREVSVQVSDDGSVAALTCTGPSGREIVVPKGYRPFTKESVTLCRLASETGSGAAALARTISDGR